MQMIAIAGNIGKDAETRNAGDGTVTSFSVATKSREGRENVTYWFDVSLWGRRGEALRQYLTKGSSVTVSGTLGRREHDGKTYLKVRADQVTLMGGNRDGASRNDGGGYGQSGGYADGPPGGGSSDIDDEIPF